MIYAQELIERGTLGRPVQYIQVGCRLIKGGWCFLVFTAVNKMLAALEVAKWLPRNLSETMEWFLSIGDRVKPQVSRITWEARTFTL